MKATKLETIKMPITRERKTTDLWVVQQYTGAQYGWEDVSAADNRKEAQEDRKAYAENQPEYPVRMVKRRVPKEIGES
jgi:hypothetical protein